MTVGPHAPAQTYRDVQGIADIEAAFKTLSGCATGALMKAPWVAIQAIELIYICNTELLRRAADRGTRDYALLLRTFVWVEELLDVSHGFLRLSVDGAASATAPAGVSSGMNAFATEFARVESALLEPFERDVDDISASIASGTIAEPLANLIHVLKNVVFLNELIWASWRIPSTSNGGLGAVPGADALVRAMYAVRAGAEDPIFPFRMLHQIPELCALLILELTGEARKLLREREFAAAVERTHLCNAFLSMIVACNRPIRRLMLPAEYYRIRGDFGETSGAHSVALRGEVFGRTYMEFAQDVQEATKRSTCDPVGLLLRREVQSMSRHIHDWRSLHLAFPRNLLGGFRTASLAGSPDGLKAAEIMRDRFAQNDPLHGRGKPSTASPGRALDIMLRRLTADATQSKYADVQQRAVAAVS